MNNEIKEISNWLNQIIKENKESDVSLNSCVIPFETLYKLQDYITNLQEENERLHNQYDLMENSLDEKQEVIDKAIEYIEEHIKYECDGTYSGMSFYSHHLYDNFKKEDLLDILRGNNEENKE